MTESSPGFGAMAELEVTIGNAAEVGAGRAFPDRQERLDRAVRFIKPPPQQVTIPASGIILASFNGPELGYQWTVRKITVADAATTSATVAGTAWVYAGVSTGGATAILPSNLEWILNPLPNVAVFSADEVVLQQGENLYVNITGGTNGQNLMIGVQYQLYPAGAVRERTTV